VTGCAQNGQSTSSPSGSQTGRGQTAWYNPSTWFNGNSNGRVTQSPDISHIKGPLTPPEPAPFNSVQRATLPPALMQKEIISQAPAPAPVIEGAPVIEPPQGKVKVAILLPLTGRNAALGKAMLNAAQQAVFDAGDDRFELMPQDTGDNDGNAETAARRALVEGAQLIIGPLFAAKVPMVRDAAQNSGVNILTLSNDTSLAGNGVYVMGFAPGAQVDRIVRYAASRGLRHFAALIPGNPYGALAAEAFKRSVNQAGGTVVAVETYDPAKHDATAHIANLASQRDHIDALFLPMGGNDLVQIAMQLGNAGFDNNQARLLGTGLWDTQDLGRQSAFLDSGWYAAADPAARQSFITTYKSANGSEPPRIVTLAYDATALAAVLEKRGGHFGAEDLTNPNGFIGLDGIFRLTPQGLTERGLAVLTVTTEGPRVIDPAPTTFAR